MDYYSPFWGSEAISIVVEPEGALTCRLSTLTVLADFGPFHGLLLTLRAENGVESFRFFGPKMETERKYENGNGNLQNGSRNGIFYAETGTKTKQCFSVKHA